MGSLSLTSIFPHSLSIVYLAVYNQTLFKKWIPGSGFLAGLLRLWPLLEMDLSFSLFAELGGFGPKPTHFSFHLLWQISVLGWVLFPHFLSARRQLDPEAPFADRVDYLRWLFTYASITNLCSLVLDRCCEASQIVVVHDTQTCFSVDFPFLDTVNSSCLSLCATLTLSSYTAIMHNTSNQN